MEILYLCFETKDNFTYFKLSLTKNNNVTFFSTIFFLETYNDNKMINKTKFFFNFCFMIIYKDMKIYKFSMQMYEDIQVEIMNILGNDNFRFA